MISPDRWRLRADYDADPKPRRPGKVAAHVAPENVHLRCQACDGPVQRSITAACRDALKTGAKVREVTL